MGRCGSRPRDGAAVDVEQDRLISHLLAALWRSIKLSFAACFSWLLVIFPIDLTRRPSDDRRGKLFSINGQLIRRFQLAGRRFRRIHHHCRHFGVGRAESALRARTTFNAICRRKNPAASVTAFLRQSSDVPFTLPLPRLRLFPKVSNLHGSPNFYH